MFRRFKLYLPDGMGLNKNVEFAKNIVTYLGLVVG